MSSDKGTLTLAAMSSTVIETKEILYAQVTHFTPAGVLGKIGIEIVRFLPIKTLWYKLLSSTVKTAYDS